MKRADAAKIAANHAYNPYLIKQLAGQMHTHDENEMAWTVQDMLSYKVDTTLLE
eukprot:CAMPEP_0202876450 /NCGR_PEP_ID=MMETSP1391-20130828/29000_1 /ASSEMBLY_ACC=CAM_ASM_000867 /TAXON_ID=1034604 /ORGANISM="Chlamydomonas leiostraca, Strain SAG 11-49" /LENGTH=53 /DNA_ID=CAMNT_0049558295 /DNA_START=39 /DNA_END=197 /DNA_ORIENTATION=-